MGGIKLSQRFTTSPSLNEVRQPPPKFFHFFCFAFFLAGVVRGEMKESLWGREGRVNALNVFESESSPCFTTKAGWEE